MWSVFSWVLTHIFPFRKGAIYSGLPYRTAVVLDLKCLVVTPSKSCKSKALYVLLTDRVTLYPEHSETHQSSLSHWLKKLHTQRVHKQWLALRNYWREINPADICLVVCQKRWWKQQRKKATYLQFCPIQALQREGEKIETKENFWHSYSISNWKISKKILCR